MGSLEGVVGDPAPTLPRLLEVGVSFSTTFLSFLKAGEMFKYDLIDVKFEKKWRIALKLCQGDLPDSFGSPWGWLLLLIYL